MDVKSTLGLHFNLQLGRLQWAGINTLPNPDIAEITRTITHATPQENTSYGRMKNPQANSLCPPRRHLFAQSPIRPPVVYPQQAGAYNDRLQDEYAQTGADDSRQNNAPERLSRKEALPPI